MRNKKRKKEQAPNKKKKKKKKRKSKRRTRKKISAIPKNMVCKAQTLLCGISPNLIAGLALRTAKRIVNANTDPQGSSDNDKLANGIL